MEGVCGSELAVYQEHHAMWELAICWKYSTKDARAVELVRDAYVRHSVLRWTLEQEQRQRQKRTATPDFKSRIEATTLAGRC